MLPTRTLGDLRVSALGLGCMGMSHAYGTPDLDESRATLDAALDAGVTLFDTADMYGNGANEEFLGPFVRANRERIVLATKFGFVNDENQRRSASTVVRSASRVVSTPRCAGSAWT